MVTLGAMHRNATTSRCGKQIEVCCRHPRSPEPQELEKPPRPDCPVNDKIFGGQISDEICLPEAKPVPAGRQCGTRNIDGVSKNVKVVPPLQTTSQELKIIDLGFEI